MRALALGLIQSLRIDRINSMSRPRHSRRFPGLTRSRQKQQERRVRRSLMEWLEPRHLMAGAITSLVLPNDTGASSTDQITEDSRVQATIGGSWSGSLQIQFDHTGDGVAELTRSVASAGQTVQY